MEKQSAAFVVHGSTAASLVWSMLARWGDPVRPPAPGRYLWHGWWLVVADVVRPLPTDVEDALATSDHAVVVAGAAGGVRAWRVSPDVLGVRPVDVWSEAPELRAPVYLAELPARLRRRRRRKGEAADLAPQLEAFLAAWGWPVRRDVDPTRTLTGATSLDPSTGENPDTHMVGERILCREMSRWALDLADPDTLGVELEPGAFVLALWDRDNPPDPVEVWVVSEDDDSSLLSARLEWRRRETDVVRGQCRLDGQRFWAAHRDRVVSPVFDRWLGALVHWHPDRRSSLFGLVEPDQPASTMALTGVGRAFLASGTAQRFDPSAPAGLPVDVELDDLATALRVAAAAYPHTLEGWQPVPDDVPRDLAGTSAWAYEHCAERLRPRP